MFDLTDLPLPAELAAYVAQMTDAKETGVRLALAEGDWDRYLRWHGSHEALPAFLQIIDRLKDADYWRLLAEVWSGVDLVFPDLAIWRRLLLALPAVLIGLISAGSALAADPRVRLTADPVELPAGQLCDFDVLITYEDFDQYIVRSTTAPDGTMTVRITGRARAIVTNQDTGEFVRYNISGPGTLVFNPDGSFSGDLAGPNHLFTARENLEDLPAVLTLSYTTGRVTFAGAASGSDNFVHPRGRHGPDRRMRGPRSREAPRNTARCDVFLFIAG